MYRPGTGPLVLSVAFSLSLAACGEQGLQGAAGNTATAAAERPAAMRLTQREVEAPQVFQRTEAGLWDGRPSLGGVWVAHPDVTDPERVLIRNEATGDTVVGALFRRERENPGPRFQVSSDAAAALGLIAGAPTKLSVTALRRQEAPAGMDDAAGNAAEGGAEPAAVAEADAAQEGAAADATESPRRGGILAFLRGGDAGEPGAVAQEADAAGPAGAAEDNTVPAEAAADAPAADAPAAAQEDRAGGGFLFGLFSRERSEPGDMEADAAPPTQAPAATLPDATPEARAALERDLVQIGIFSVEGNADRTAEMMRDNGLTPTVYEHASAGKSYWRVVVGPATTRAERDRLQARARSLGFTDAFPVSR